ncbi:hypothetical protein [Amycolatopsis jiangsuensis]|uniref:Uncharacterized protein n=1 Tax=Amycolatopsis jiangsuensis TaxID=1181879 RepID=A0A840J727_9PSEU|nr:hypothetical protein [Amycolatopsis jiangsuensis]MBB4689593.1 hypothetical protein [Amycolatopsis jiangsuensis]
MFGVPSSGSERDRELEDGNHGISCRANPLAAPAVPSSRVDVYSGVVRLAATVWAGEFVAEGTCSDTAIMLVHPMSSMLVHYALVPLAQRGPVAGGLTTCYVRNDSLLITDNVLVDIAAMVRHLREDRGYRRIILVGNPGGASMVPYYQIQAQHGHGDRPGGQRPEPQPVRVPARRCDRDADGALVPRSAGNRVAGPGDQRRAGAVRARLGTRHVRRARRSALQAGNS